MANADLSEFLEIAKPRGRQCAIQAAAPQLSDEDRDSVMAAIAQPRNIFSSAVIEEWFKRRGLRVSANAVHAHRIEKCSCFRANE